MDKATALGSLELDSGRILAAASTGAANLDAPVPACPGWDVRELVSHLGAIYDRTRIITVEGRQLRPDPGEVSKAPEGDAERLNWFAERRSALLAALVGQQDEALVWNFAASSPAPAAFWWRRMAHETLVHRTDVEQALGIEPAPAEPEVAVDNIDEFLEYFLPRLEPGLPESGLGGTVHLHATDHASAEWTIEVRPGGSSVVRSHEKADVALRGVASDLAMFVWGRLSPSRLEVFGDSAVAARWQEVLKP